LPPPLLDSIVATTPAGWAATLVALCVAEGHMLSCVEPAEEDAKGDVNAGGRWITRAVHSSPGVGVVTSAPAPAQAPFSKAVAVGFQGLLCRRR